MQSNQEIFLQIFSLSNHSAFLDALMIFGAVYIIWITAFLAVIFGIFGSNKEKKALILSVAGIIIAWIIIFIIRLFIFEPRPFITLSLAPLINETSPASFPSIHATFMAVAAFAYLFAKSKWSPLFIFFLVWVALARIYVGVHYPLDIMGGILVGFISVFLSSKLLNKFHLHLQ